VPFCALVAKTENPINISSESAKKKKEEKESLVSSAFE